MGPEDSQMADHRHALGHERHLRAGAVADVDAAGGHGLAILLPPVKSTIFRSSPCFLKMPSLSPTLTGMIGSAFGAALPTVSVTAAADAQQSGRSCDHEQRGNEAAAQEFPIMASSSDGF